MPRPLVENLKRAFERERTPTLAVSAVGHEAQKRCDRGGERHVIEALIELSEVDPRFALALPTCVQPELLATVAARIVAVPTDGDDALTHWKFTRAGRALAWSGDWRGAAAALRAAMRVDAANLTAPDPSHLLVDIVVAHWKILGTDERLAAESYLRWGCDLVEKNRVLGRSVVASQRFLDSVRSGKQ